MDKKELQTRLGNIAADATLAGISRTDIIGELESCKLCIFQAFVKAQEQEEQAIRGN